MSGVERDFKIALEVRALRVGIASDRPRSAAPILQTA